MAGDRTSEHVFKADQNGFALLCHQVNISATPHHHFTLYSHLALLSNSAEGKTLNSPSSPKQFPWPLKKQHKIIRPPNL